MAYMVPPAGRDKTCDTIANEIRVDLKKHEITEFMHKVNASTKKKKSPLISGICGNEAGRTVSVA